MTRITLEEEEKRLWGPSQVKKLELWNLYVAQRAKLDALKSRLEISADHPFDGIECRDVTIRGLEQDLSSLREQLRIAQLEARRVVVLPELTEDEEHAIIREFALKEEWPDDDVSSIRPLSPGEVVATPSTHWETCRECGGRMALSDGWVPSYNDPDNLNNAPSSEPFCPKCDSAHPQDTVVAGKTNRELHEEAAGMGLEDAFFRMNGIDPDAIPSATPQDTVVVGRDLLDRALSALRCSEPYKACGHDHTQKRLDAIDALCVALRTSAQAQTGEESIQAPAQRGEG